jgi:two-component system cell cycle sensor histidine kinase PleC
VEDTGIGIKKEHIPKMLEPFQQASNTHNRTHEGTGLGLAITNSLIELHDGALEVQSEEGKGTTMFVHLSRHRLREREELAMAAQ